jgi:uncharacterized phage protein (TIGR02220 family)
MAEYTKALSELGRPVAYYPTIAKAFGGDVATAIFVCQFMYWSGKVGDRFIYKTRDEIEEETGIGSSAQRRVTKKLRAAGYVTVVKKGIPSKNYYRFDWKKIDKHLKAHIETSSSNESSEQEVPKQENKSSQNDSTSSSDSLELEVSNQEDQSCGFVRTNTESTSEITPETTEEGPDPIAVADAVIDYLNSKADRSYKHKNSSREHIVARLHEGFTQAECEKVIDNKVATWKGDAKMDQYLRPSTLFAPSKFEAYLNEKPKKPERVYTNELPGTRDYTYERQYAAGGN